MGKLQSVPLLKIYRVSNNLITHINSQSLISIYKLFQLTDKNMGILKKISSFIKLNDIFYSSELLRYQKENQFQTVTGGLLSIGIWVTVIVSFASMVLETFNLSIITSEQTIIKQDYPPKLQMSTGKDSKFMFGVRITDLNTKFLNLNAQKRYFDIYFAKVAFRGGILDGIDFVPLQKCTKDHWSHFPNIAKNYDALMMDYWLCPPKDTKFNLQGFMISDSSSTTALQITACNNYTNINNVCASPEQIEEFMQNSTNLSVNIFFTNPVINPNQKDYIDYYLEDNGYAIFSKNIGAQVKIFLADYLITSDNSYWPFASITQQNGAILDGSIIDRAIAINPAMPVYAMISIVKSATSIQIKREVQKISAVLSFIGGFYGALIAALFVIKSYTDSAFQFSLATNLFEGWHEDINGEKEKQQSFHLFKFFAIKIYTFLQYIGIKINWDKMKKIIDGQQEIQNHLNIASVLHRIITIEDYLSYLFEDYQIEGIKMQKSKTIDRVKQLRKKFREEPTENEQQNTENNEKDVRDVHQLIEPSPSQIFNETNNNNLNSGKQLIFGLNQRQNPSILGFKNSNEKDELQSVEVLKLQKPIFTNSLNNSGALRPNERSKKDKEYQILYQLKESSNKSKVSEKIWSRIPQRHKTLTRIKKN